MLPHEQQYGHDRGERGDHGVWMLCIVQSQQPGLQSAQEHEAVLSFLHCLCYALPGMGEALSIGTVYYLQIVENCEDWDRGELVSDGLQSQ